VRNDYRPSPDAVQLGVRSTGVQQRVSGARVSAVEERLNLIMAHAVSHGAHVWLAMTGHLISPTLAARLADGSDEEPSLDVESLVTVSLGCFRCERELTSSRVRQPCPGEPR
jgi:hypothetical protein